MTTLIWIILGRYVVDNGAETKHFHRFSSALRCARVRDGEIRDLSDCSTIVIDD